MTEGEQSDRPARAPVPVDGTCDSRFRAVRDAFVTNLTERGDVGAAVAVTVAGRVVVDVWGGFADRARTAPWKRDTLVNVFSVSKGLATACVLGLVSDGRLDLDAPVARYWPEFARADKASITVRHVLTHRAGLPALHAPLPDEAMFDWTVMIAAYEAQTPWWAPGTAHGYHVNSFGFLVGELIRRITGQSLGTWLRERIAGPLGADAHIGLPTAAHARVAEFLWPPDARAGRRPDATAVSPDDLMRWCAYWNPAGISGAQWVNTAAWRAAELPSSNGHATARGIARVYAALARGGTIDGVTIVAPTVLTEALQEQSVGVDRILDRPSRFGVGFQLTQPERPLGPNPAAFGHFGTGGSVGFCDPTADVAFAYVMNDMGPRWQNPRNRALVDALYTCL